MSEAKITILCSRPGMRRAGAEHPAKATYDADHFSEEQIAAIEADPLFQIIEGVAADGSGAASLEAAEDQIKLLGDTLKLRDDEIADLKKHNGELTAAEKKSATSIKWLEAKVKKLEGDLAKAKAPAK